MDDLFSHIESIDVGDEDMSQLLHDLTDEQSIDWMIDDRSDNVFETIDEEQNVLSDTLPREPLLDRLVLAHHSTSRLWHYISSLSSCRDSVIDEIEKIFTQQVDALLQQGLSMSLALRRSPVDFAESSNSSGIQISSFPGNSAQEAWRFSTLSSATVPL